MQHLLCCVVFSFIHQVQALLAHCTAYSLTSLYRKIQRVSKGIIKTPSPMQYHPTTVLHNLIPATQAPLVRRSLYCSVQSSVFCLYSVVEPAQLPSSIVLSPVIPP